MSKWIKILAYPNADLKRLGISVHFWLAKDYATAEKYIEESELKIFNLEVIE